MPHTLTRQTNEQSVLETLYHHGPLTRVELAQRLALSQPTVNSLVSDLEAVDLLYATGKVEGRRGRAPSVYAVNSSAGHIVGVDVGGTRIASAVSNLIGEELERRRDATNTDSAEALLEQIVTIARALINKAEIPWSAVQVVTVGLPATVDPDSGRVGLGSNLPSFGDLDVAAELESLLGTKVRLDNDVNLAAIGERWRGAAVGIDDFAFVSIGAGIGVGLILDGDVWLGRSGAAGEIAWLPIGGDPFDADANAKGALGEAVAGRGVVRRYQGLLPSAPEAITAEGIFDLAAEGDAEALQVVDAEARLVAMAVAAITTVVEPSLVVLGGGIGAKPLLLEPVRTHLARIVPRPPSLASSALGDEAGLVGAISSGLHLARARLLGDRSLTVGVGTG